MSAIEDARKLVQDIIAPDLKAISARLDALEANMKQRFDSVEKLSEARQDLILLRMEAGFAAVDARLAAAEAKSTAGFAAVEARFAAADARFDAILKAINIDRRLEMLEAAQAKETPRGELHA